jgi:hypothetical protein
MAEKLTPVILAGLSRAASSAGLPLHGTRSATGLFPNTAAGKQAAQTCCSEGYLTTLPTESSPCRDGGGTTTAVRKKAGAALYTITDAGLEFLFVQVSPREAFAEFAAALRSREGQLGELCDLTRNTLATTEALRVSIEKALDRIVGQAAPTAGNLKALLSEFLGEAQRPDEKPEPSAALENCILEELGRWQQSAACEDYALPALHRHACTHIPGLTIGAFHDVLRRLQECGKIYLHPWTGPLYELPEPPCALLVGHEIAYYASLK